VRVHLAPEGLDVEGLHGVASIPLYWVEVVGCGQWKGAWAASPLNVG